ncbi:MAG: carbonate dehydratase, partial [Gammaproteobacteria bacterium HGW-Gammaproteobacteria-12]
VLTEENVVAQLDHLRTHPSVAARLASGQLQIHGWVYDIDSGSIRAYDAASGNFLALDGDEQPCATPQPRYASA